MLPMPRSYAIYPSVMEADQPTEIVIAPAERAFLLFDGEEYTVKIYPVDGDEPCYHDPTARTVYTLTPKDGVLRFTHTFEGEQEHLIYLVKNDKRLQSFTVFSAYADLLELVPLRGDFHGHSYRSDGLRDPAALAGHYREQGYDFFSLTDHNRFYPGGEVDEVYAGVHTEFVRVPGEEVHCPDSIVHIVHVGGRQGVANQYIHDRENYDAKIAEYEARVPADLPEQYRGRYARAMWATDAIHAAGGLAIFAHPYWRPAGRVHNVRDEFARRLLSSGMFDAYELIGGNGQVGNNRSVALWNELRVEGVRIPAVGSSDVHGIEKAGAFPHFFTLCFAKSNDPDDIVAAVKAGNCVAVEAQGADYNRQHRCYGSLRLVTYAQYLLNHFYPHAQRIAQCEGIAMRQYAMNEAPAALIELCGKQAAEHRARFFGKLAPVLPDAEMIAFEEKWRARHVEEGPVTKGSAIDSDVVTRQI